MTQVLRLPPPLREFLRMPGPQSLLVRGPAGSGKSALALTLLEEFEGRKFLVTGRVSKSEIARCFPWLGESGRGPLEVFDASAAPAGPVPEEAAAAARTAGGGASPSPPGAGALPPAIVAAWRRSGQDPLASRDLSWLPPELRAVWRRLEGSTSNLVVIDSWDAVVDEYLDAVNVGNPVHPDRDQLERMLLRQINRGTSHFVLVVERDTPTKLDFLVSGIVDLGKEWYEGSLERWLTVSKLRGVRAESPNCPFTLQDGGFRCFVPIPGESHLRRVTAVPDPQRDPTSIWSGSRDFDRIYGRLPDGGVTVIEHDPGVPDASWEAIVFPIILTVLRKWGRVLAVAPATLDLTQFWNMFREWIPEDVLESQFRFLTTGRAPAEELPLRRLMIPSRGVHWSGEIRDRPTRLEEFLTGHTAATVPNLIVASADAVREINRNEGVPITPDSPAPSLIGLAHGTPVHAVVMAATGDPLVGILRGQTLIHLVLRNRRARTFVYGIRPTAHGEVLVTDGAGPDEPYRLFETV